MKIDEKNDARSVGEQTFEIRLFFPIKNDRNRVSPCLAILFILNYLP